MTIVLQDWRPAARRDVGRTIIEQGLHGLGGGIPRRRAMGDMAHLAERSLADVGIERRDIMRLAAEAGHGRR